MDIVLHSFGMPFNGETVATKSLGGSESAGYYQARELARRGHRVTVFTSSPDEGVWDDVTYCFCGPVNDSTPLGERFEFYARNTPHDVLIIQRHPGAFHNQFASKINIWQLHDLALYRTAAMANHQMFQVDAVTVVSDWHKKQVCEVYGFDPEFVRIVPNGVDPELYEGVPLNVHDIESIEQNVERDHSWMVKVNPLKRAAKFLLLYQSRPERGLEHLLRPGGIMDRLRDTNAHLLCCTYDNNPAPMAGFYAYLKQCAENLPNVTMLPALSKPQLAVLQKSCDLLVYPTEFEEVSCISAMEAMHAGLPMLTSVVGALPETCELVDSCTLFVDLKDGRADEDKFVERIMALQKTWAEDPEQRKHDVGCQLAAAKYRTWEKAVDHLEAVIEECMERRKGTTAAVERHSIEHSDIGFLKSHPPIPVGNEIEVRTAGEIYKLYEFALSPEAYTAHYAKHGGIYYDDHEDKVIGEDVTRTNRFVAVAISLENAILIRDSSGKPTGSRNLRVLDYGCAHGHYMMPLAKAFPGCRFTGVDVSERAIAAATKWAIRDQVTNVELRLGNQDVLKDVSTLCPLVYDEESVQLDGNAAIAKKAHRDLFDVIIAGEIVEHVPDWMQLLEDFRNVLKPGGLLIVTTPYGRWEWTGTEAFREAREHLHHFERADIREICGRNEVQISYAPAGHDKTGRPLGSWVWAVRPNEPFNEPDYERKRAQLCPRETLSACLIVKDGEKTLRKSIESFIDWVDEIVIAIDPKTKDRTREVIDQLATDYRWKPFTVFDGAVALEQGFDLARNLTVERACGDWIIWVDADEEVRNPQNLWKYLRPSQHNAFGFPQVHYSADPDQVLTVDYPCRLFRNRKGIQFYGVVHEHPEIEAGKAIPRSALRYDVKFLHCGYVDEEVRRSRYMRNLPLLHRDLQKHPDRGLNRFLWLRDIAQGLMFEHEQTGGAVLEGHRERAMEGIRLFEQIIEKDPTRMAVDSLQYYSHCVQTTGQGYEINVSFNSAHPGAPDLNCAMSFKGRFFSTDHYTKLMRKIEQEATRHYDSKYL